MDKLGVHSEIEAKQFTEFADANKDVRKALKKLERK
jgi:hypothetical protein